MIWVRSLDTLEARPIPGTSGATLPFWSPDSRFIAFEAGGNLKKIEPFEGSAQIVCSLTGVFAGGAWAPDGTILIALRGQPLVWVSAAGGAAAPLATLDATRQKE